MGSDTRHQILHTSRKGIEIGSGDGVAAEDWSSGQICALMGARKEILTFVAFVLHRIKRE